MKTATKWFIGIVIGLVILCVVAAGVYVAFNWWHGASWMTEVRTGRLWDDGKVMPYQDMPWHRMPMHRTWGSPINRVLVNVFPIRAIAGFILCLALPALIVLGVVALLLSQRRSRQSTAAAVAAASTPAAPAPEATPVADQDKEETVSRPCSNCGRSVNQDWIICPYCGNALK
jgi:hypothetical protein